MSKVYLIASGKGGTGKTMFAANLGASLALRGKKVVMVDMDMGLRNLDLYLGLESNVVFDVHDVLTGVCTIKQALVQDPRLPSLCLLSSSPERDRGDLTPLHMKVLCEKLKERFDYVIIDAPSGIDDGLLLASAGADEAIIVSMPEFAALRDADAADRELKRLGIEKRYVVLNKLIAEMMTAGYVPHLRVITSILNSELLGVIQFDTNINISTNVGVPIVMKGGTYIRQNFDQMIDRLSRR